MSVSTRMLRIAVVAACPFPFPRGTPIRIQRLAEALGRRGHEVTVLTYPVGRGDVGAGVRVVRVPQPPWKARTAPGPSYGKLLVLDPLLTRLVRRTCARERPDLIYAHHYEGLLAAVAGRGRGGPPVVYDAHTTLESELPYSGMLPGRAVKRRLGRMLDRRLVPLSDAVVCVNGELSDRLRALAGGRVGWVETVEGGVELERFTPRAPGSEPPGAGRAPILVYAGNLAPYQGIEDLMRAFARVREEVGAARLRVVTSEEASLGPYRRLAEELGIRDGIEHRRVSFDELPGLLAESDLALHPRPPCAGTPLKLLNYLAAGLPVVSFASSGRVLNDGETGVLVPDGDVAAFAAAVVALLRDPERARRLARAGRAVAGTRFSWDAAARMLEARFTALVPAG